jgi:hypothetical protein
LATGLGSVSLRFYPALTIRRTDAAEIDVFGRRDPCSLSRPLQAVFGPLGRMLERAVSSPDFVNIQ